MRRIMRKTSVFAAVLIIAMLLLAACGKAGEAAGEAEEQSEAAPEETVIEEQAPAASGDFSYEMTADLTGLFDVAMENYVGVNYEPVVYLGTPSSNPLGSSFLCKATAVVPDAVPYWAIVTVQDVGDTVSVEDVRVIDYAASSSANTAVLADDQGEPLLGGWEDAAAEDLTGDIIPEDVVPVAVLASQVVSGMNYCCLVCNDGSWNLVYVYQDLQGGADVTNSVALDF